SSPLSLPILLLLSFLILLSREGHVGIADPFHSSHSSLFPMAIFRMLDDSPHALVHERAQKIASPNLMLPLLFFSQVEPEKAVMDYISSFDIRLGKETYFAGESIEGSVLLENTENIKIKGIRVLLRGKVHATLKVVKSGERRTMKDDQYIIDEKTVIWGNDKSAEVEVIPILPRGVHQLPFTFEIPQTALPCSLESRYGTIRYYIKVIIDIPYASSPQGIKYFTVIGPHIDCMEQKYLSPLTGQDRMTTCCMCCQRGALAMRVTMDRTAYHVEYFIDKGVLGESKSLVCTVFEHKSPPIAANKAGKYDSTLENPICLPVVPPTLVGVCRLVQIYYNLKVCLEDEKGNESLPLDFPLTVATLPYHVPNTPMPLIDYEFCSNHVEGGKYVSPEFRLGQVYDGEDGEQREEEIVLYRPVYVKIADRRTIRPTKDFKGSHTHMAGSMQSILTDNGGRRRSGAATPTIVTGRKHDEEMAQEIIDKVSAAIEKIELKEETRPLINGEATETK
ncbi:hypothetical protein PENTCL1PPCAC_6205, partial [Pristionchus entomophagus]